MTVALRRRANVKRVKSECQHRHELIYHGRMFCQGTTKLDIGFIKLEIGLTRLDKA
jgi:hypothetical protein